MRNACLPALAACLLPAIACAQVPPVSTQQHGGTYVEPPAQVPGIYTPQGPNVPSAQADADAPLTLTLVLDMPLRSGGRASLGRGTQGSTAVSPTLQAALRWRPIEDSYWFAQLVFFRYLRPDRQQPWHPDFSYAFGYEDYRPGSWSLVYSNYTGTRLRPDRAAGESRFNLAQGLLTLSHRFELPKPLQPWLLAGDGDAALCSANAHAMPRYVEIADGREHAFKPSVSLGCRYTRAGGWFADFTAFAWPGARQQPWDPDFTYAFGYEHPGPGRLTVKYNNYSGNRWPGRARGAGEGNFTSGSVSLAWSAEW